MKVWLAQGFGVGRIPVAPGTFGSIVGLLWFALLLCSGSWLLFGIGAAAAVALSVWLCGEAEKILGQKDPGSVVMDEIAAIPLCFASWMIIEFYRTNHWAGVEYFFSPRNLPATAGVFLLFRLFDVWKPWPIRQSQSLPGGWGITIDDVLAAVFVNVVVIVFLLAAVF